MSAFQSAWQPYYGERLPLGYAVRGGNRWLRFHSLPESKRYAETEAEMASLLARQNLIAEKVLGSGAACWMASCIYLPNPGDRGDDLWLQGHADLFKAYDLAFAYRVDVSEAERADDEHDQVVHAAQTTWVSGKFDSVLRQIAADEVRVLWMSVATGAIFAPYDGGVDLILAQPSDVARLRAEHPDWLSNHPTGM